VDSNISPHNTLARNLFFNAEWKGATDNRNNLSSSPSAPGSRPTKCARLGCADVEPDKFILLPACLPYRIGLLPPLNACATGSTPGPLHFALAERKINPSANLFPILRQPCAWSMSRGTRLHLVYASFVAAREQQPEMAVLGGSDKTNCPTFNAISRLRRRPKP